MTAKLSFRKWLELERIRQQLTKTTESSEFPEMVYSFLSVAYSKSANRNETWENSVFSFIKASNELQPKKIPLLEGSPVKDKPVSWDYEGRTWAYWSHLLAKAYGWTLEYIAGLDVNEALARVQEILTDEQLDKEFAYGLSEIAYPYNSSLKKSVFKPMPRPYWMKASVSSIQKTKFKRNMLPVGMVQDVSGMSAEFNPLRDTVVYKQEKTEPSTSP